MVVVPVANAGGTPGIAVSPNHDRWHGTRARGDVGGELSAAAFTGAPEQLWRIDQLTDGTYRISPKAVPERLNRWRYPPSAAAAHAREVRSCERSSTLDSRSTVMNRSITTLCLCVAFAWNVHAEEATPRPAPSSLTQPKGTSENVDNRGFIHRWLVLEPLPVAGRLTEAAVEEAVHSAQFLREVRRCRRIVKP